MNRFLMLALALTSLSLPAHAWNQPSPDLKQASKFSIDSQSLDNVVTSTATNVLNADAGDTTGLGATVTSFLAQPDYARNLVIQANSFSTNVAAGNVVVSGWDITGRPLTESFAFTSTQSTATTGVKAFAKIYSIVFPAESSPYSATWNVGFGNKLGFKKCLDGTNMTLKTLTDGVDIAPSAITADSTVVSKNTLTPASAPNGSRDYRFLFVENYCN